MKKVILSIVSTIMVVSLYAQSTSEGKKKHEVHDFFLKGISRFNEHNLVTEINSKTVVVDFKWHTYPQGKGPGFHGVGSGVYVKKKGRWVEVLEHETVTKVDDGIMPKSEAKKKY